jgi:pimeloyl-[acyl-carrier protein] methyl ester esterase
MILATHTTGDGPNLTLVHGWGLGNAALDKLALALGEHFSVNQVDLPGYGDTPPVESGEPLTIETVADALAATLPPRAMLCGWSLGAMVCLACAARHPRLVARMVLVGATASFVVREGWPEAMPEAQVEAFRQALTADSTQQLKRFSSLIHQGAAQPREAQRYLNSSTDASTDTSDAGLKVSLDLLTQTDLRPLLNAVRQPVLLVHGAADTLMPLAAAEHLMLALPDARLEVFGGSAHAPFASDPARFVESVQRFAGMLE